MRRILALVLILAACGKPKPASNPQTTPSGSSGPVTPPDATLPDATDPTVAAVWTASHLLAGTLESTTFQVTTVSDGDNTQSQVKGSCPTAGTVFGSVDTSAIFTLTFRGCGGTALNLQASDIALTFALEASRAQQAVTGFVLNLTSQGSLAFKGDASFTLAYDELDILVVKNSDGTVSMTLTGDATLNGTTTTFKNQVFTFPGAD